MMADYIAFVAPSFSAYLSGIPLYATLALMGIFIGFIAGLFGVGGGFLLVPCLNIILGIPIELAAGSVTCYIIGTSTTGIVRQIQNSNVEWNVLLIIAMGSITGAIGGDILQDFLIQYAAGGDSHFFEQIMLIVFFLFLILIAGLMIKRPSKKASLLLLQRFPIGPRVKLRQSGIEGISVTGLILMGIGGGLLTGLMGVSGGVLFMPLLTLGVGLSPHKAAGTSLGIVLFSSITAVAKKGFSGGGKVSLIIALALLAASFIGVQAGITIAGKIGGHTLKKYFSLIVIAAACMVLFKVVTGLL